MIGSLIGHRRPELVHQVSGCDDLQPVEPGLATDPGGGGEITDNAQDIGFVHGARKAAMQNLAIGRRRDDGKPVAGIGVGAPAKMGDLRHQRGTMPVIEIGKLGKEGNDVVVDDQLVEDRRGVGRDSARPADKGQADAAFRLFHLVAKRGVCRPARLSVAERMAGTEDPVFQPDRTKLECLQKRITSLAFHCLSPPSTICVSSGAARRSARKGPTRDEPTRNGPTRQYNHSWRLGRYHKVGRPLRAQRRLGGGG